MARFARTTAALAVLSVALAVAATSAVEQFPPRIDFPKNPNTGGNWAAEGIFGNGHTFWAGDTSNGAIVKGDVRTGETSILVQPPPQGVRSALGVFVDKWNRLWVAGGTAPVGGTERHALVYDADTGALIKDILLANTTTTPGIGTINDVTVTKDAAYFTNTNAATSPASANILFKVPLGKHGEIGDPVRVPIPFFGANGIEATKNGKTLIVVSIGQSKYYKIDADTAGCPNLILGECEELTLTEDGAPAIAPRGDGLILRGHTLYSVLNLPNAAFPGMCGDIVKIKLHDHMTTGEIVDHLNNPDDPLVNPATADLFGKYIYVVRRNSNLPAACTTTGLTAERWLTRVDKHGGDDDDED